jgi:hypothetical protein
VSGPEERKGNEKMVTYLSIVFGHLLKLLALAAGAIYTGMVLMKYRTDGPRYRPNFELRDPARSMQNLVVWLGVKVLDACLRFAGAIFNMLLEASAEVGEWFMRRSPAVRQSMRSRFLV